MGRYVILLILPVIAGVLIAAGAILVNALRQHRIDVRRTLLEARLPNLALSSLTLPLEGCRLSSLPLI